MTELLLGLFGLGMVACLIGVGSVKRVLRLADLCDRARSELDESLRWRHRLIPMLAQTVQDTGGCDRVGLKALVDAHALALQSGHEAARMAAEENVTMRLAEVMAEGEAEPNAHVSPEFADIRRQLDDLEVQIVTERHRYNLAAREFNQAIATFPDNLVAAGLQLVPRRPFRHGRLSPLAEDAASIQS